MEWTNDLIQVWHFPRKDVPHDIRVIYFILIIELTKFSVRRAESCQLETSSCALFKAMQDQSAFQQPTNHPEHQFLRRLGRKSLGFPVSGKGVHVQRFCERSPGRIPRRLLASELVASLREVKRNEKEEGKRLIFGFLKHDQKLDFINIRRCTKFIAKI